MNTEPQTTAQLAAIVRRDAPESMLKYVDDEQLNRIAGLVAHHGARVVACSAVGSTAMSDRHARRQQRRLIRARVKADTTGIGIGVVVLGSILSWCVQRLLDWMFSSPENTAACLAIGNSLPAWNDEDRAAVAAVSIQDDEGDD